MEPLAGKTFSDCQEKPLDFFLLPSKDFMVCVCDMAACWLAPPGCIWLMAAMVTWFIAACWRLKLGFRFIPDCACDISAGGT